MLSITPKTQEQTQENAYNQQIAILTHQAEQAKNPEFAYQTIAVVHFKNNQPAKGLEAVKLCKKASKKNNTPITRIYLAIFKRAEYLASTHETANLEKARKDLLKISGLKDIPTGGQNNIEALRKSVMDELDKNKVAIAHEKAINDICIIPKAGQTFYESNFQRYINNIKRNATVPKDLNFIRSENDKKFDNGGICYVTRGTEVRFNDILSFKENAFNKLSNDDDEFLNTGFTKKQWKCNLRETADCLKQLTREGTITKEMCATCYFHIGEVYNYFEHYLFGIYNFSIAEGLGPNLAFNNDINIVLNKLYKMTPKERLKWIDIAILEKAKEGSVDKDLLLWKAEAHFLSDQEAEGKACAQILLRMINKTDPEYAFVFQMANS